MRKKEKEREARKAMEATIKESDLLGKTEEEIDMMKVMGFSGFNTTKGKKVSFYPAICVCYKFQFLAQCRKH